MLNFKIDEELSLREFVETDAEAVFETVMANYEHLALFMHWITPQYSLSSAREFIRHSAEMRASRKGLNFGIFRSGGFIGSIGFVKFDWLSMKTEIGYWITVTESGKGTISRAGEMLVHHAFDELGMNRIEIRCSSENVRSAAVAKRLGFIKEGVLREAEMRNGRLHDFEIYGLLKREWEGPQSVI